MKLRILGSFLMGATMMLAASKTPKPAAGSDLDIAAQVRRQLVAYGNYNIFDEVNFTVTNGQVELNGVVSDPAKKPVFDKLVHGIRGVTGVTDDIRPLSNSMVDQQLRAKVAGAIYNDPIFSQMGATKPGPIHILVDHAQVTLQGAVSTQFEKDAAGQRAGIPAFQSAPVLNQLQVQSTATRS